MLRPFAFPIDSFLARFPEFDNEAEYPKTFVSNCGQRASMHVTPDAEGMPMVGPYREYALFLMTGHIITLAKMNESENGEDNNYGVAGVPFKATVGSVSIEATKPNSFQSDDWNYWLSQTTYGRELLAYLDTQAQAIFLNTPNDTVRDLV